MAVAQIKIELLARIRNKCFFSNGGFVTNKHKNEHKNTTINLQEIPRTRILKK